MNSENSFQDENMEFEGFIHDKDELKYKYKKCKMCDRIINYAFYSDGICDECFKVNKESEGKPVVYKRALIPKIDFVGVEKDDDNKSVALAFEGQKNWVSFMEDLCYDMINMKVSDKEGDLDRYTRRLLKKYFHESAIKIVKKYLYENDINTDLDLWCRMHSYDTGINIHAFNDFIDGLCLLVSSFVESGTEIGK